MLELIQILQEWLSALIGDHPYTLVVTNLALTVFVLLIYWLIYALVFRGFRALSRRVLKEDSDVQPLRIQKQEILSAAEVAGILNRTFQVISWVLRIFIIISFLNTVLGLFSWTLVLAEKSTGLLRGAYCYDPRRGFSLSARFRFSGIPGRVDFHRRIVFPGINICGCQWRGGDRHYLYAGISDGRPGSHLRLRRKSHRAYRFRDANPYTEER
jgi:hypothetical protein